MQLSRLWTKLRILFLHGRDCANLCSGPPSPFEALKSWIAKSSVSPAFWSWASTSSNRRERSQPGIWEMSCVCSWASMWVRRRKINWRSPFCNSRLSWMDSEVKQKSKQSFAHLIIPPVHFLNMFVFHNESNTHYDGCGLSTFITQRH